MSGRDGDGDGDTLLLLPRPRKLVRFQGRGARADAPVTRKHEPALARENFTLDTTGTAPLLCYADDAARRYGEQLLAQLRAQTSGEHFPALRVEDSPDFPVRGFLLDISRNRVPTRACLAQWVEWLALFRINHLQLYTEHTFAYRAHEVVWRKASPLTAADIRWLDALCHARGIELCANQNSFGHMEHWLAHAQYRARAETPAGFRDASERAHPPRTLAPTADNARFATALFRELLAAHSSRRINIGCDEPFELGRGASKNAVRVRGRERVYLEHLQRLIAGARAEESHALFWGDVLRGAPALAAELPRDYCTALAWHYEAPFEGALPASVARAYENFGIRASADALRNMDAQADAFARACLPFWVCPGTSSWNSFTGRWPNARENLRDAAHTGRARGADGYLITDWGDNGHLQPPSVSVPALTYGAALAWCAAANRELQLAPLLDAFVFEDETRTLGAALLRAGEVGGETGLRAWNASPLFHAITGRGALGLHGTLDAERSAEVARELETLHTQIGAARARCENGALIQRELQQAVNLARLGATQLTRGTRDDALQAELAHAREEQRACWQRRSRVGGLEDSIASLS